MVGTSLGTDKGVAKLIVYRMKFMGLSTKDRLLNIIFTPPIMAKLCMVLESESMLNPNFSPIKALTTYLARATSLDKARTLCRELNQQLSPTS